MSRLFVILRDYMILLMKKRLQEKLGANSQIQDNEHKASGQTLMGKLSGIYLILKIKQQIVFIRSLCILN